MTKASGTVVANLAGNVTKTNYCYYFVTPASATNIELQFVFSSSPGDGFFDIDNITLNSISNLIKNGDFETIPQNQSIAPWYPWSVNFCPQVCTAQVVNKTTSEYFHSFLTSGVGILLNQAVATNTIGRKFVYLLEFGLSYTTALGIPGTCSITLKTT